ncbi:MAG: HAD hydrolase-like protein [Anaerolineaceae bacterium]|nr:HAD hydrolase-like protein [Anaerolineaceae bacterium]
MNERKITTLVFDWGNTIMADDGQFSGKMMDWPSVQAIEGAYDTLKLLSAEYQLVLASNAEDSTPRDIFNALEQVNLDPFFHLIFTCKELSAKKPDLLFYQTLVEKINHPVEKVVMIGDDYLKDIVGSKLAGWRAIWFNPSGQTSNGHLPLQDMEVRNLTDIPEVLSHPFLPDVQTCLGWYMELGATHTLLSHVQNVAAIAYQISLWLEQPGMFISPLLAHRGGLTHDLSKLQDQSKNNHAVLAAEFLESKKQLKLAEIARRHLIGDLVTDETRPQTWEEKIVNYADKLSEGNTIVSIDERLEALQLRYPDFALKIKKNTPFVKALEDEIVTALGTTPAKLVADLKKTLFNKNSHSSKGML